MIPIGKILSLPPVGRLIEQESAFTSIGVHENYSQYEERKNMGATRDRSPLEKPRCGGMNPLTSTSERTRNKLPLNCT